MRTLAALLLFLPLASLAQNAPPPEVPAAQPAAMAAPAPQPPPPPSPAPYAPPFQRRDPWYIGFGIGGGSGSGTDASGTTKFTDGLTDPTTVFINFKVGATMTPKLLLGLDISAVRTQGTALGVTLGIQTTNYDAMVTFFPMERGLFLRGGVGLSRITADVTNGVDRVAETNSGVNLTVGAGYAFWIGRTFNMTINLDLSAQKFNSGKLTVTSGSTAALWLGFDWY
jgi:hypothetical protein